MTNSKQRLLSGLVQGPIKRLAATVEQAVAEAQMYLQAANDSERGGTWNEQVSKEAPGVAALLG